MAKRGNGIVRGLFRNALREGRDTGGGALPSDKRLLAPEHYAFDPISRLGPEVDMPRSGHTDEKSNGAALIRSNVHCPITGDQIRPT